METSLLIGWTTVNAEKAAEILARGMIEQGLAVCVQIDGPIRSIYKWDGAVQSGHEWRLMVKFSAMQSDRINTFIKENHPYDVPEWIVVQADQVAPDYLKWAVN